MLVVGRASQRTDLEEGGSLKRRDLAAGAIITLSGEIKTHFVPEVGIPLSVDGTVLAWYWGCGRPSWFSL
jgi:hypothetical protein